MKDARPSPARALACEIGAEARKRDAYVRELIDARRAGSQLSAEDFAFAQVLAFGVTACKGTLDEVIDRSLDSPKDIKPKLRDALRISAYELVFLGKPDYVVVNEGVELAASVAPRARRLANAVLRKMIADVRGEAPFPWRDPSADDEAFARSFGVPTWLAQALIAEYGRFGPATVAAAATTTAAPASAATILAADLEAAPTFLVDNAFLPGERFAADLSAQQVASLVPVGGAVLEVGAGRGTKTMLLQCRSMREYGRTADLHAVDLHAFKLRLLEDRMEAAGVDTVVTYAGDACDLNALAGLPDSFDAALLDAPCSGTGTLRRHPEITWRLGPEDIDSLADLQCALLVGAAGRVKVGGTLVYATCSILRKENEGVVERFLAGEQGRCFVVDPLGADELIGGMPEAFITGEGFFASVPSAGGSDGHFAARFVRKRS